MTDDVRALFEFRTRLIDSLRDNEQKLRTALDLDDTIPGLADLDDVLTLRDTLRAEFNHTETVVKAVELRARDAIASQGMSEWEDDRHKLKMIYPSDKETIVRELLLANNVPVDKINAATKRTPVSPWLSISAKKQK